MSTLSYKLGIYKNFLKSKTPNNTEIKDWLDCLSTSAHALEDQLKSAIQLSESCEGLKEENETLIEKVKTSKLIYESCEKMKSENWRLSKRFDEVVDSYRSLERDLQKEREAFRDYRKSAEERLANISTELREKDLVIDTLREEIRRGDEAFGFLEDRCSSLDAALEEAQNEKSVLRMKAEQEISGLKAKVKDEESVSDRLLKASLNADDEVDEVFVPACFRNTK